jgi:hypothetical protein
VNGITTQGAFKRRFTYFTVTLKDEWKTQGGVLDKEKLSRLSDEEQSRYPHLSFSRWKLVKEGNELNVVDMKESLSADDVGIIVRALLVSRERRSLDVGSTTKCFIDRMQSEFFARDDVEVEPQSGKPLWCTSTKKRKTKKQVARTLEAAMLLRNYSRVLRIRTKLTWSGLNARLHAGLQFLFFKES